MQTGILHHLLSLIGDPLGTLRALVRKGIGAIRAFLGSAGRLLRPLIKRAISSIASKLAPVAATARSKVRDVLSSLKQRVQEVMKDRAPQPQGAAKDPGPTADRSTAVSGTVVAPHGAVAPRPTGTAASTSVPEVKRAMPAAARSSNLALTKLAPVLRRAVVLTLGNPSGRAQREAHVRPAQPPRFSSVRAAPPS